MPAGTRASSASQSTSAYSDDLTVYLVLNDHGQFGIAYDETDPAEADRETIIRNFLTGHYSDALRVVAFNTAEGWSRDVSEDIAGEVLERAFDADDNLSEDTKRFIDRHVTPGEKRPPAPSLRRPCIASRGTKDRHVRRKKPRCFRMLTIGRARPPISAPWRSAQARNISCSRI
jgi:hypothetical protein